MEIDACALMYEAFQSARHADPRAGLMLQPRAAALDLVERQRAFIVRCADLDGADPESWPYCLDRDVILELAGTRICSRRSGTCI